MRVHILDGGSTWACTIKHGKISCECTLFVNYALTSVSFVRSSSKIILEMTLRDGIRSCHNVALDVVEVEFFVGYLGLKHYLICLALLYYNNNKFLLFLKIKKISKRRYFDGINHTERYLLNLFQKFISKVVSKDRNVDIVFQENE